MKTDWSQMGGYWVSMPERFPDSPGLYHVTTSRLREMHLKWDGKRWHLPHNEDHVVYWRDTLTDPTTGKTKPWEAI